MAGPSLLCLFLLLGSVFGDTGEVKTVSVMEGKSVTLHTDATEIQGAINLRWTFNNEETSIAQIDKETNKILIPGNNDERFRDRLQLNDQTGSLTITNSRTSDSGLYELQISKNSGVLYNRFNVTVSESTHSMNPGWIAFIVLTILIVPAVIIYFIYHKIYKNRNGAL